MAEVSTIYRQLGPGYNGFYYSWRNYSLPTDYGKKIDQIKSELSDDVIINTQKAMAQRYSYMIQDNNKQSLVNELNKLTHEEIVDNFNKNNQFMQLLQSVVFNKFKTTNFSAMVKNQDGNMELQQLKQGDKLNLNVLQELTNRYQKIVDSVLTQADKAMSYQELNDYKKHFANLQNDINTLVKFINQKTLQGGDVEYSDFLGLEVEKNLSKGQKVSLIQSLVGIGNVIAGQSLEDQATFYINNSDTFQAYQAINTGKIKVNGKSIKEDVMIFDNLDFEFTTTDNRIIRLSNLKNSQNDISLSMEDYQILQKQMKAAISAKTSVKMKNYSLHSDLTLANLLESGVPLGEYYWALWHTKQISYSHKISGLDKSHKDMIDYNRQLLNYEISRQLPRFIGENVTFFDTPNSGIQDVWSYLSEVWARNNYVHVSGTGWQNKKMSVILP